jgi:predicted transcriptional regulator
MGAREAVKCPGCKHGRIKSDRNGRRNYIAVVRLAAGPESAPPQIEVKMPAVPIRKSISPDFLICLDDLTGLGLTPQQYREKWNLPSDYPLVAPNYAAQRSALAKQIGLGQIRPKADARKSHGRPKAEKT